MTILLYANYATSTLAFPVQPSDTTATLAAGTGTFFPQPSTGEGFYLTFQSASTGQESEIVLVTSIFGDTIMAMERAQQGTVAQQWAVGDIAAQFNTAGDMQNFIQTAVSGGITSVSVANANGLTGTSSGGSTPALTLGTTVGTSLSPKILKGDGTSISAASAGIDYAIPPTGTSILYGNGSGGFSNVNVGSGLNFSGGTLSAPSGTTISVDSAHGFAGTVTNGAINLTTTVGSSGTSSILKGNGTSISAASSGVDYAPATSGTNSQLLANNGSGGFNNVNIGTNLNYNTATNTLSSTAGVASVGGNTPISVSTVSGVATVSITAANASTNGYLTSTDWNTFNSKSGSTTGTNSQLLANNGSGGYDNVTVGTNLNYNTTTKTLSASGGISSITGTAPVSVTTVSGASTISMAAANTSTNGYLTSTDWNTFNSKQAAGAYLTSVTADAPLSGAGTSASHLTISAATASTNGYLTSTDWTTFNSKQAAGAYLTTVSANAPITGDGTSGNPLTMAAATGSVNGYLSSADWTTFNNKQPAGSYLTSISVSSPITGNGTSGNPLTMSAASASTNGYLTSTDWSAFNSKLSGTGTTTNILTGNGSGGITSVTPRTWLTYNYNSGSPYLANTPSTSSAATYSSWDSSTTDMLLITAQTGTITIGADSKSLRDPVDGQKFIFRIVATAAGAITVNMTTGIDYAFRSIGGITLSSISVTATGTLYVGCLYNVTAKRWDVVAAGVG